jgi:hypothetical protein
MNKIFSRRNLLRGAGVAIALPWLESLAPRIAGAATGTAPIRYMPIFIPNGAPDFFPPTGNATSWQLGSVLEPFAELKAKMQVLLHLENGSAFNSDGSSSVEPSHGRQPGGWLTATDAATVRKQLGVTQANGVSVDQVMAQHALFKGKTALDSMQVGLSTVYSSCDSEECSISRSVSWKTQTQPTGKDVDPLTVFNKIVAGVKPGGTTGTDVEAMKRLARKKSVLDSVLENSTATRAKLSISDQKRMDEFLTSVRDVEMAATQVSTGMGGVAACALPAAPTMKTVTPDGLRQTTANYNKGNHADAMNGLVTLALQCDVTRIITYMLEDERSEFVYDNVTKRKFSGSTSTQTSGTCPEWHNGGQHGDPNDFGAIVWWNMGKVADLCRKMDAIKEANGLSLLDNTVIFLGAAMHGSDHACHELPAVLIGSGGGKLKQDQLVTLNNRPLRDLHFTIMNSVMGMGQTDFGHNLTGKPISLINEIIAAT